MKAWTLHDGLPWRDAAALLRASVRVLRENGWILVVMLAGCIVSQIIEDTVFVILMSPADATGLSGYSKPEFVTTLSNALRWTWAMALEQVAALVWVSPIGMFGTWLAVLFAGRFWRKIRAHLGPPPDSRTKWSAVLWTAYWISALGALCYPVVVMAASAKGRDAAAELYPALICTGILGFCFNIAANSFLQIGMFRAVRLALEGRAVGWRDLLEIDRQTFLCLLKFNIIALGVMVIFSYVWISIPNVLSAWKLNSLARLALDLQSIALDTVLPVLQIAVFPVPFIIVMGSASISAALREDLNLWQRHWKRLLTLLFPLLLVAMALWFVHRVSGFCVTQPLTRSGVDLFFSAVDALISTLWIVVVVGMLLRIRQS